jgi:hypothetical protein
MLGQNRLLELALKGLKTERLRWDEEMAAIQRQLKGHSAPAVARVVVHYFRSQGPSAENVSDL